MRSRPDSGRHAQQSAREAAAAGGPETGAGGGTAVAARPEDDEATPAADERTATATEQRDGELGRGLGDIDFATYVQESLRERESAPARERLRAEERVPLERTGQGTLYRSGELRAEERYDDNVLGLNYSTVAPRAAIGDERWAWALRSFARAAVWLLPAGVLLLALSAVFGWPTASGESALVGAGWWLLVTSLGLGFWLLGVVALGALVAASRVRPWGILAVISTVLGVALLSPVVGAVGLGRPAIRHSARDVANDPNIAGAASQMQDALIDNSVGKWLLVAGGVLLGLGALAVVGAILGSRLLQRHDGWLVLAGVIIAMIAAFLLWEFLFIVAAMVTLAGALGLAYTVSRIAPDGTAPPAY